MVAIQVVTLRFPEPRTPTTLYIRTEGGLAPMSTLKAIGEEVDKLLSNWMEWSHWTWDGTLSAQEFDKRVQAFSSTASPS